MKTVSIARVSLSILSALSAFAAAAVASGQSSGGPFSLTGRPGGGGVSVGGEYRLAGAAAQPSGGFSIGADYLLYSAIAGVFAVQTPGQPRLEVVFTSDKLARLSWPADAVGFALEFSSNLGPSAVWQPVDPTPSGNSYTTPCAQPGRFFRLRRQP